MAAKPHIKDAEKTYAGFLSLMKMGTIACAVLGIFIVFLIA